MAKKQTKRVPLREQPAHPVVEARWLLIAGLISFGVALLLAYIAVCALFWQGEWQLVLHPSHATVQTPQGAGLDAAPVEFGQGLRGWWIAGAAASDPAVLMLPSGDGDASAWLFRAKTFHDAGLNVLLFDYSGAGRSDGKHPDEASMEMDSEAALSYMTGRVSGRVILYGAGAGASLAARLCAEHTEIGGLILEQAAGDFQEKARKDSRASIVPFGLIFHEDFPLAAPLHALATPKLLITYTTGAPPAAMQGAGDPKIMLEIPNKDDEKDVEAELGRFLSSYFGGSVGQLR